MLKGSYQMWFEVSVGVPTEEKRKFIKVSVCLFVYSHITASWNDTVNIWIFIGSHPVLHGVKIAQIYIIF